MSLTTIVESLNQVLNYVGEPNVETPAFFSLSKEDSATITNYVDNLILSHMNDDLQSIACHVACAVELDESVFLELAAQNGFGFDSDEIAAAYLMNEYDYESNCYNLAYDLRIRMSASTFEYIISNQ